MSGPFEKREKGFRKRKPEREKSKVKKGKNKNLYQRYTPKI